MQLPSSSLPRIGVAPWRLSGVVCTALLNDPRHHVVVYCGLGVNGILQPKLVVPSLQQRFR